jgi:serine/threonine-protein kinase
MSGAPLEGRYALQREVGTGGNGRVFIAEDLKLGRAVAVKMLGPLPAGGEREAVQRLEREGRVASAINHPNVCSVSDIGRLPNGLPYLVLELLNGETLAERIDRTGKLRLDAAMFLGEQMLLGLAAAHRIGIIHRDVKPPNMFLVNLGHGRELLKLLDFGTARVPGGPPSDGATLTRAGLVVGTVDYMAPEQVRGLRGFDTRTDVYAAGVVLYEMLSGHRPFRGLGLEALCQAIAFKQAPSISKVVPDVPPSIARAIDRALSVDIKRRHADAGAFLTALRVRDTAADGWDLSTSQATPQAKEVPAAAPVIVEPPGDWDLATHKMVPEAVGALSRPPTNSTEIEITFAPESVAGAGASPPAVEGAVETERAPRRR